MERVYSIDLLKFCSALIVAVLHLHWQYVPQGYLSVEIFFIASGFFIGLRRTKYLDRSIGLIIFRRLRSFYLFYFITFLLTLYFFPLPGINEAISYLGFLSHIGLGVWYGHQSMWFLGVYLLSFTLILVILRLVPEDRLPMILGMVVFVLLSVLHNSSESHALNKTYEEFICFMPFAVYRGVVAMMVGTLCGIIANLIQRLPLPTRRISTVYGICLIVAVAFLMYIIFHQVTAAYDFFIYPVAGFILIALNANLDFISRKINYLSNKLQFLTSTSLEVYLFHPFVAFSYMKWPEAKGFLVQHPAVYLISVIFFAFAIRFVVMQFSKILQKYSS